ncbi:SDR family NAD(P)-dependent oxidoreductase [Nocardioides zeae]
MRLAGTAAARASSSSPAQPGDGGDARDDPRRGRLDRAPRGRRRRRARGRGDRGRRGRAAAYRLDVTDRAAWERLVTQVRTEHGALHGLVNNAGISRRLRFMDTGPDVWAQVMAINVDGPFHGMQTCAPLLRDSGGGSIVNISSIAGQIGYFSPSYSTSKWALRGLTKSAAGELAPWGIRVNSVHPGLVETPLLAGADGFVTSAVASIPFGRMGRPDEVTDVVRFLLGGGSSYMTGAELTVDGGLVSNGTYHRIVTEMDGEL